MSTDRTTPLITSLHPRQTAAIVAREFSVALSAGAGCGKTFVLTERFLSHLEPPGDSGGKNSAESACGDHLYRTGGAGDARPDSRGVHEAAEELPGSGGRTLAGVAPRVGFARISTIHSFCGSLLRSHAVEAGLDPRFSVLDAAQSDTLLFELIDRGLRRRLADRDEAVIELVVKYGLDRLREMVGRLLGQRQDIDFPAWHDKTPEELTALWEKYFPETVFPQMLREIIESAAGRTVMEVARKPCPCSHAVMQERMATILETMEKISARSSGLSPATVLSHLEILREAAKVQGAGTKKNWPHEELYNQFRDAAEELRRLIDAFKKNASFDAAAALPVGRDGRCGSCV